MLYLATTDLLRIVVGTGGDLDTYASWTDNVSGAFTSGRTLNANVTASGNTTIVAAPASGIRSVRHINISNNSSTVTTTLAVELFDGTNVIELRGVTLLPGENLSMVDGTWHHRDAQNADYGYVAPARGNLGATGTIAESIPRELCPEVNTTVGATGVLFMQAIYLTAGQLISTIDLWSATTAAGTPTNYNVGLYDSNRNLLAQGTNQTTAAWAANSIKSFTLTSAYRVTVSGLYYVGYYMTATTVATLKGGTARTGGQLAASAPTLSGTSSSTGLTTTLPNPAGAITGGTASIYVAAR